MINAVAGFIDAGRIKLSCVDSIDAASWYDFGMTAAKRNVTSPEIAGIWEIPGY